MAFITFPYTLPDGRRVLTPREHMSWVIQRWQCLGLSVYSPLWRASESLIQALQKMWPNFALEAKLWLQDTATPGGNPDAASFLADWYRDLRIDIPGWPVRVATAHLPIVGEPTPSSALVLPALLSSAWGMSHVRNSALVSWQKEIMIATGNGMAASLPSLPDSGPEWPF